MGTIVATVTSGLHATTSKTYTIADGDIERFVAAYQQDANMSINGVATYGQVLLYIFNTVLVGGLASKVKAADATTAQAAIVLPTPIVAT